MKGEEVLFGYDNITICLYTHTHRHLLWRIWWAAWHSRQHQSWAGNIASHPRRHLTCENEYLEMSGHHGHFPVCLPFGSLWTVVFHCYSTLKWFPWIIAGSRGQKSLVGKAWSLSWQEFWSSLITDSGRSMEWCANVCLQVGLPAHLPWKHGRKFICPTAAALGAKSPELISAFLGKPEGTQGVESCDENLYWRGRQSQRPLLKYENDSTWRFVQLTDIGWSTASDFPRFQASRCKHICGQHRSIAWRTCMPLEKEARNLKG